MYRILQPSVTVKFPAEEQHAENFIAMLFYNMNADTVVLNIIFLEPRLETRVESSEVIR